MTTRKVKVATLSATAAVLAVLMLVYPALVTPAAATTTTTSTSNTPTTSTNLGYPDGPGGPGQGPPGSQVMIVGQQGPGLGSGQKVSVTDGQTFTLTSTTGNYGVVGSTTQNGTASGTITFTVTGSLTAGDTLSISGSVVIGGTTYTISSGSAEMNPSATAISGQGSTSPTGEFLLHANSHGSFVGSNGQVSLDLSNGTTEYLVFLTGAITS